MNNSKDMTLKAKLAVDLNSFKDFEKKIQSLAKTFTSLQANIATSLQGMDKTIQQAFFGKRGTDRTTIQTFFKKEFKAITTMFVNEIKAASAQIVAASSNVSGDTIAQIAAIILKQQQKIESLTKNATKNAAKSTTGAAKSTKFKLSDDDKAFRAYVMAWQKQQDTFIKMVEKDKAIRLKHENELNKSKIKERELVKKLASQVPQAAFLPKSIDNRLVNKSVNYQSGMADMKQFYTKQAGDALKAQISQNLAAVKASRKLDEQDYQQKVKIEKEKTRLHGEELMAQLKAEQTLYAEKKRLKEQELENAKTTVKTLLGMGDNSFLSSIKAAPMQSFMDGMKQAYSGLTGVFSSLKEKATQFFKVIVTGTAISVASFLGIGGVVKKLASGVLFATEKMRGYEIALFGMMKTQDGVNQLMEKAFKVTKNLPISYEQVYQSTKAFTLIGPVRDMLKNVGETETVLKRMYSITMALSQIEPEWGLAGAQFSLREALSGDLRSLQRRFEIPVNLIYAKDGRSLRQLKNDPEAMSQALSDYFKEFYNEETLGMAANQFGAVISKIEGIWVNFQGTIGNAGFYDLFVDKLKKIRDDLDAFTETAEFDNVTNRISNALGSSLNSVESIVEKLIVGFGKLIGINIESSNVFQMAADGVEKFAAALRIIDRLITELDLFGMLNSALKTTSKIVQDIAKFGNRVFKSIAQDIGAIATAINKLPLDKISISEFGAKGIFYTWLFGGPGNIFNLITGVGTAAIATIYSIKNIFAGVMAANTWAADKFGVSVMAIGVKAAGVVFGFEQWGGSFKFAIDSIDERLESSVFYKVFAWLSGEETTENRWDKFNKLASQFTGSSDLYNKTSPVKSLTFAKSLAETTGMSESKITTSMQRDTGVFLQAIMKKEGGTEQLLSAIENLSVVTTKMAANDPRRLQMERTIAVMAGTVADLKGIDIRDLNRRFEAQAKLNGEYEERNNSGEYGNASRVLQKMKNFWNDTKSLVGNSIDAINEVLKPSIDSSERLLMSARSGPILNRGEDAITNIDAGAKLVGAGLLDAFKTAGYGVGVTSGYRADEKGTQHNVGGKSFAIDYQPNIAGQLLTGADVQTPQFEALVNMLKANENIANLILEYKDKSIFGDKFKGMTRSEPSAKNGVVMHLEFKKGLAETEEGVKSIFSSFGTMYDVAAKAAQVTSEEMGKASPQLKKIDPLKQDFQRATEFIKNVYMPMMNYVKDDYQSASELIAGEAGLNASEELFKGLEDDGVAKAGPRLINKIKKNFENQRAQFNDIVNKAGGVYKLIDDVTGKYTRSFLSSFTDNPLDFSDMLKNILNFEEVSKKIEASEINKQESINTAMWKGVVEKKSFEFVDMIGTDVNEIRQDLMTSMLTEASTKIAHDSDMKSEGREAFEKTISLIYSKMKLGMTFSEALLNTKIDNKGIEQSVKLTEQLVENIYSENGAYLLQKRIIAANIVELKRYVNIQKLAADKSSFMGDKETRSEYFGVYSKLLGEGQNAGYGDAFITGIQSAQNEFQNSFEIMYEAGKELNNNLEKTFEDGFFNMLSGKINSMADMFNELGNVIKNTILGIISKMLAISATKMVLGIDIQGGITGGASGAGGGIVNSLIGGIFSGGSSGGLLGNLLGSFGTPGIKNSGAVATGLSTGVNMLSGGFDLSSAMTSAVAGAAAGTKGTGILGKLTGVKDFIMRPAGLATMGAAAFLTQPGRLFGGSKDKTGAAREQYSSYTDQRTGMVNRRNVDATNYYMGGTSGLENYQFGGIGYNTWKSGDGWFKGPKENHAAADPTAFLASMKEYYAQLMTVGQQHYSSMKEIYKKQQINSLEATKMQYQFDTKKTSLIQAEYNRFAVDTYTAADKWEKMDEYRDQLLDSQYSNWQTEQEIQNIQKETKYAEMEYLTYVKSNGQDTMAMTKTSIEIQKMKIAELDEYTLEWYNAKMELFQSEKELTDSLKESAKALKNNISAGVKEIYQLGVNTKVFVPGPTFNRRLNAKTLTGADSNAYTYAKKLTAIDKLSSNNMSIDDIINSGYASLSGKTGSGTYADKYIGTGYAQMIQHPSGAYSSITKSADSFEEFDKSVKYIETLYTSAGRNISTYNTSSPFYTDSKFYKNADEGGISRKNILSLESPGTVTYDFYKSEEIMEDTYKMVGSEVEYTLEELKEVLKEKLETDAANFLTNYKLDVQLIEMYGEIGDIMSGVDDNLRERYEKLKRIKVNYDADVSLGLMSEDERTTAQKELSVDVATFYTDLANSVNGWLQAGYFSVEDVAITGFADAISGGLNDMSLSMYESLKKSSLKTKTKGDMFSSLKDMEDFSVFNQVMAMDEMKDFGNLVGVKKPFQIRANRREPYVYADGTVEDYTSGTIKQPDYSSNFGTDDPYEAWFNFNKQQIQTRIENTKGKEGMEEEYYQAEYDLYTLLIDNAQRLKEKADEVNRSIEDMLGKIEETMRMRIAEERTTTKGDIIFMDVGSTRNSQAMLDKMLAAIQTNDPKARELVEEFRKKMAGIGR